MHRPDTEAEGRAASNIVPAGLARAAIRNPKNEMSTASSSDIEVQNGAKPVGGPTL